VTCIVGVDLGDRVVIAADRRVTCGDELISDSEEKLLAFGPWVLGLAGTVAAKQAFLKAAGPLTAATSVDEFTAAASDALRAADFNLHSDRGGPKDHGTSCVLASRFGIGILYSSGGVTMLEQGRPVAVGCGSPYALGYLTGRKIDETEVAGAIRAACDWSVFCGGEAVVKVVHRAGLIGRGLACAPAVSWTANLATVALVEQ
jgi:ATP-dependent protease HslVU (ClpYQ) peptidase subunit